MAQRRFSIAVRHPLASAASSTPSQLPSGDETPRNEKEELPLGDVTPGTTTTTAPKLQGYGRTKKSFPWGTKPRGQKKSFPWGTKPRGQQQRQRPTFKGAVKQRRSSLSGRNPGDKRRASLGGRNPMDNNNDNAQPSRVRSNNDNKKTATIFMGTARIMYKSSIMDTASTMFIMDCGHSKDYGNNNKDNNKEDAQPPRVRRTKQASPPECIFLFSQEHPTTLNIV